MKVEYEATFENVEKDEMRKLLKKAGAKLIAEEFMQKRDVFFLPDKSSDAWLRVREGSGKSEMSLKVVDGDGIEDQKEICLQVENYDDAVDFLKNIGCEWKGYQETKREAWSLDGAEITIDEWPFLEPFVEVEGESGQKVEKACEKLGLDYNKALFCAIGFLYKRKYGLTLEQINNKTPRITFDMENPFIKE